MTKPASNRTGTPWRKHLNIGCTLLLVGAFAAAWYIIQSRPPDNLLHGRMKELPVYEREFIVGWRSSREMVLWRTIPQGSTIESQIVLRSNGPDAVIPIDMQPHGPNLYRYIAELSADGNSVAWLDRSKHGLSIATCRITSGIIVAKTLPEISKKFLWQYPLWLRDNRHLITQVGNSLRALDEGAIGGRFCARIDSSSTSTAEILPMDDPISTSEILGELQDGRIVTYDLETEDCVFRYLDPRKPTSQADVRRYRLQTADGRSVEARLSPDGNRIVLADNFREKPSDWQRFVARLTHRPIECPIRHNIWVMQSDLSHCSEVGYYLEPDALDILVDRHELLWRDSNHISLWCRGKYYSLKVND